MYLDAVGTQGVIACRHEGPLSSRRWPAKLLGDSGQPVSDFGAASSNASEPVARWEPGAQRALAEAQSALGLAEGSRHVAVGSRGIAKGHFLQGVVSLLSGRPRRCA